MGEWQLGHICLVLTFLKPVTPARSNDGAAGAQEKISNPSTKVLVSADEGGLAITHLHHVNTSRRKNQWREMLIKHQDLGVTLVCHCRMAMLTLREKRQQYLSPTTHLCSPLPSANLPQLIRSANKWKPNLDSQLSNFSFGFVPLFFPFPKIKKGKMNKGVRYNESSMWKQ